MLAEPQVAVEVLAGRCAASVIAEVLAGRAASGCLRYLLADVPQVAGGVLAGRRVGRKWLTRYLLVKVLQEVGGVLAGRWAASGCQGTCW